MEMSDGLDQSVLELLLKYHLDYLYTMFFQETFRDIWKYRGGGVILHLIE